MCHIPHIPSKYPLKIKGRKFHTLSKDLSEKLVKNGLAFEHRDAIYLNSYGELAEKIGFKNYFDLNKLEEEWLQEVKTKDLWKLRIIFAILISIILALVCFIIWLQ